MEDIKKEFFIEYSQTPNLYKKIIREEFNNRTEVRNRFVELTGTYNPDVETYIHEWQAGMPFSDYEHFYEPY